MPKTVIEMTCPKCGQQTQYNTGLCEWCGADLFPQHGRPAPAHLPDASPTPLYQLRQQNVRDYQIGSLLSVGAFVAFFLFAMTGRGRYGSPAILPMPFELRLALMGLSAVAGFVGSYLVRRSRQTRICARCGGIMMLEDASLMWETVFFSRHIWRRYTYMCSVCHDVTSIMR